MTAAQGPQPVIKQEQGSSAGLQAGTDTTLPAAAAQHTVSTAGTDSTAEVPVTTAAAPKAGRPQRRPRQKQQDAQLQESAQQEPPPAQEAAPSGQAPPAKRGARSTRSAGVSSAAANSAVCADQDPVPAGQTVAADTPAQPSAGLSGKPAQQQQAKQATQRSKRKAAAEKPASNGPKKRSMIRAVASAPVANYQQNIATMGLEPSAANMQATSYNVQHQLQEQRQAAAPAFVSFTALLQDDDLQQQEPCMPAQQQPQQQELCLAGAQAPQQEPGAQHAAVAPAQLTACMPVVCAQAVAAAPISTGAAASEAPAQLAPPAVAVPAVTAPAAVIVEVKSEQQALLQDSSAPSTTQQVSLQDSMQLQAGEGAQVAAEDDAMQAQQQEPKPADADVRAAVQGLENQMDQLQHKYAKPQVLLQAQESQQQDGEAQHTAAGASADSAANSEAAPAEQGSSISPDATVVLLQQQAACAAAAEAEAAATAAAMAAAAREHQQRIESAPVHKRAFEALVAAAAAEAEAAEAASGDEPAPKPPVGKKQRRGRGRSTPAAAAAAAAAAGTNGGAAAADACAYIAVPGQAVDAAEGAGFSQEEDPAALGKVGRLAEAVAAALAAAAAAGQDGSAAAAAAAAAAGTYEGALPDDRAPNGHAQDQFGAGYEGMFGWVEGAWDGSWEGNGYAEDGSMQGQGAQPQGDPQRAMKKRLAASESYKRKKEQEAQLNAYWAGLQVGVVWESSGVNTT